MINRSLISLFFFSVSLVFQASAQESPLEGEPASSQDDAPSLKIELSDTPYSIDPAISLPQSLAATETVQFQETSLKDVISWLGEKTGFHIVMDDRSMASAGILSSEPVTDALDNEPIYLILDRLEAIGIQWRWEGKVIHLDALKDPIIFTRQYNLGKLLDLGFKPDDISYAIESCVASESWETNGGDGSIVMLGDVMFLRQSNTVHRRVAGLIGALIQPGRQTFVFAPSQNEELRKLTEKNISVEFNDTPLSEVVASLAKLTEGNIRLDLKALEKVGIRKRTPISLFIQDQPLQLVLKLLCAPEKMDWKIEDGVLWITSTQKVNLVTAVYDVRDLCRTEEESEALSEAIASQTLPDSWMINGGSGDIVFPKPGSMVVCQNDQGQSQVFELLEIYREALRNSKPRDQVDENPVETHYYRIPTIVSTALATALP
ncbi:MAG: hypothetical protein AAF623_13955, partial [Planctomycetota bacterium]